jgi:hypothetical protein
MFGHQIPSQDNRHQWLNIGSVQYMRLDPFHGSVCFYTLIHETQDFLMETFSGTEVGWMDWLGMGATKKG